MARLGRRDLPLLPVGPREPLRRRAKFTGYDIDGGYAERTVADERFCFPIPDCYPDEHAAPLLCAGLIGYRSLRLAGEGERLGLYGFGSSAHIICQVAVARGWQVYALTREGDTETQELARSLGAEWAGAVGDPQARTSTRRSSSLRSGSSCRRRFAPSRPAGRWSRAGIHMSDIPSFPYEILWHERYDPLGGQPDAPGRRGVHPAGGRACRSRPSIQVYPLAEANRALDDMRHGRVRGTAVLSVGG